MKTTDLPLLSTLSRPTVHPDGTRAVVAVSRPDLDTDAYVGQLWNVPLNGGKPRRMTRGVHDWDPRFSPDGKLIAFIRDDDGFGQLSVVDAGGGEPVQLTERTLGVGSFRWSPDGRHIAFISRTPVHGRYGTVEGIGAEAEPPRRISTLKYRYNGLGYTIDRRAQVFIVEVPDVTAEPWIKPAPRPEHPARHRDEHASGIPHARQLTHGDFDHTALAFSEDGSRLAFVAARHPGRDQDLCTNVFELMLDGEDGDVSDLTGEHGNWSIGAIGYGPRGAVFFLASDLGESGRDFVGRNRSLYLIAGTGAAPRRLTDPEEIDLGEAGSDLTVLRTGSALVQNRTRGTVQLCQVGTDGVVRALTTGAILVTGHDSAGGATVVGFTDAKTGGDLAVVRRGALTRLTDFSAALREAGITTPQELTVVGRDGYPVHGWLVLPAGDGPHPVLLNIHGGPFAQYSASIFDEAQVYVGAGYAVLMCNPRGSSGYGEAHGRSIRQAMGTVDYTDVLDFLDGAVAEHPSLDGDRVGIMGGSYGGYLTAWTIAHDHRFAAAIVERGYLDPDAFIGTSDIGSFFSDEYTGTDADRMRAQSPQAVVGAVRTPTLIIHSANDLRCPLAQAERYFAALKRGGVPSELLVFPGENHELSRSGRPQHRLQRFEAILDWWARYLPVTANANG